ncbi:MAG TPA: carbon storage regulator [Pirellulaceae bacterium]|jgi:carbon storage regulator CsrA
MLVLSRKQQEQIKIGDQITVTIVRVKGNTVRVGIEAPRDVRVIRGELPKMDAESAETIAEVDCNVAASSETLESGQALPSGSVISFRVRCEGDGESEPVKTAHLPLKRIHDRFGDAPLKQLLASCTTLAK